MDCGTPYPPPLCFSATNGRQDFDGGIIGAFVTQQVVIERISFIHWNVVPAVNLPGGISQVENAVVEEKAWFALTSSCYALPTCR